MLDPSVIQLTQIAKRRGQYEAFYFRGTSTDGRFAFWLRHSLVRSTGGKVTTVGMLLATFDRKTGETSCIADHEEVSVEGFQQISKGGSWENCAYNFSSGSFFELSSQRLRGKLHTPRGSAAWDVSLDRSNEVFFHLPGERYYRLPLPARKLLTRDCRMGFKGRLSCAGMVLGGEFIGACGHHWGSRHAPEYAYANCNWFREDSDAVFDGFSVRLAAAGGLVKSPYLTLAALKAGGEWHYFNALTQAPRQHVDALDNYRWLLTLHNDTHRLEVAIDGANPRVEPWVAVHYEQPDGERCVVKNTKFAAGRMRLYEKKSSTPLRELSSDYVELETSLPDNVPDGKGFVGKP